MGTRDYNTRIRCWAMAWLLGGLLLAQSAAGGTFAVVEKTVLTDTLLSERSATFEFPVADPQAEYRLLIAGEDPQRHYGWNTRHQELRIELNGRLIARQRKLSQHDHSVRLQLQSHNVLTVTLRDKRHPHGHGGPRFTPQGRNVIALEVVGVDDTAPQIEAELNPVVGDNGWNGSALHVTFRCSDAVSGIATCPAAADIDVGTSVQSIEVVAADGAGNRSTLGIDVVRDAATGLVTATLQHGSADSPRAFSVFGPQRIDLQAGQGAGQQFGFTLRDPSADYTARLHNGGSAPDGWRQRVNAGHVDVNGHTVLDTQDFTRRQTVSAGLHDLAEDNTLNVVLQASQSVVDADAHGAPLQRFVEVEVIGTDSVAPTIEASVQPVPNAMGWSNSDLQVVFQCADDTSGIASCPPPVPVATEGAAQAVSGTALDNAGNRASVWVFLNLDKTPPGISHALSSPPNAAGWHRQDVTVSYTCSDTLSGVSECPASELVSTQGTISRTATAVDAAGNSASAVVSINLDKTPPTLAFVAPVQDTLTAQDPPVILISVGDNIAIDPASLAVQVDGSPAPLTCQASGADVQCTLASTLGGEGVRLTAQVADTAGWIAMAGVDVVFDHDDDGLSDGDETAIHGTRPDLRDSDGDGLSDGQEMLQYHTDPLLEDSDGDGLLDGLEVDTHGTDPLLPDSDGDHVKDGHEIQLGFDPNDRDSTPADLDGDRLPDLLDDDRDGDGVDNDSDRFPDDDTESSDLDDDGIGDNADTDRDGDGYDNVQEVAAGSDPDDAASHPDTTPPELSLDGLNMRVTEEDHVTLSGTVSDAGSGLAWVRLTSARFPETELAVLVEQGYWSVTVPLELGANPLTLVAGDTAGNQSQLAINVERNDASSPHGLYVSHPQPGSLTGEPVVAIAGILRSDSPAQHMSVSVEGHQATLTATDDLTRFEFVSREFVLKEGLNTFVIEAEVDGELVQTQAYVTYLPAGTVVAAPSIQVFSPADGSQLGDAAFSVLGEVHAPGALQALTVNGQAVAVSDIGAGRYRFRELLSFSGAQNRLRLRIEAVDMLSQSGSLDLDYYRDAQAPVIVLDRPLLPAPYENAVIEQPYRLSGEVSDAHLSTILLNGNPVGVEPGGAAGTYRFDIPLSLDATSPMELTLTAIDNAGNRRSEAYVLRLDAATTVEVLLPPDGTTLTNLGEPIALQVAARTAGTVAAGDRILVSLLDTVGSVVSEASLTGEGALRGGTLSVPALSGAYTLRYRLLTGDGLPRSTATRRIAVADPVIPEVALSHTEPAEGQQGVEPNSFISLYFNQVVDTDKLTVEVHETANGHTYQDVDAAGADALRANGYRLVAVNRSHEPVPGELSAMLGGTLVAFYPQRDLAYDAEVYVDIRYDGREMERLQFHTRRLPTFLSGAVVDQLDQPVAGVSVTLPALGRSTVTDRNGAFAFGYGDSYGHTLPGGRQQLSINPDMRDPRFGTLQQWVNLQAGRRNALPRQILPLLNSDIPFVTLGGHSRVDLVQGALKLDLDEADLQFPDGRRQGNVHAQFLDFSQIPYALDPRATPHWIYSLQPTRIAVEGEMRVDIAVPRLNQGYAHLPADVRYVLMLGLDSEAQRIVPVGVGQVHNNRIVSAGVQHFQVLDVVAYALVDESLQPLLQQYAEGVINLPALLAGIKGS